MAIVRAVLEPRQVAGHAGRRGRGRDARSSSRCCRREGCEQVQGYLFSKPVALLGADRLAGREAEAVA